MESITKNKKLISILAIAFMIFARCNMGITLNKGVLVVNLLSNLVGVLFCGALILGDKARLKKALIHPGTVWVLLFSALVFVYGKFKIGACMESMYSRQYQLLTVFPAILIMIIVFYNDEDVLGILSDVGAIITVTSLVTSLVFDPVWKEWVDGTVSESRVGATPAGTCVDTANILLILLIPILYNLYVNKSFKRYLLPAALAVFQIFASGSKSSMIPIVFVFIIMVIGASKDKKTLRRNVICLAVAMVAGIILVMTVPLLYRIIGGRFVELFTGMNDTEFDLHTSTGQRMAVVAAFKEHFWEAPIFGHGFYAFKAMDYSALEQYKENGEILYRHIHIHNNFMEILFGLGIVGLVTYYWFPAFILVKTFLSKNRQVKIIVLSFLVSFLFMDLGLDMFYKYLTPYYTYLVAYALLKKSEESALKED